MTYKSASTWADNNIPKDEYDYFDAWYDVAITEFGSAIETDKNGNPTEFRKLMQDKWLDEIGAFTREPETEDEPIEDESTVTEVETPEIPEELIDIQRARQELRRDQQLQADSTIRELEQIQKGEQEQTQQSQREQLAEAQQMEQFRRQVEQSRVELQQEGILKKQSLSQRFSSGISKFASRLGGLFRRNKK